MVALLLSFVLQAADDPAALVRRLGDESFEVREAAAQELAARGPAAEPALREGLRHKDAEVRHRCARLLRDLAAGRREAQARAFLENRSVPPGWDRFRASAGDGEAARLLFADILRADADLIVQAERDPKSALAALRTRCKQFEEACLELDQGRPTVGEVGALLLAAEAAAAEKDGETGAALWSALGALKYRPRLVQNLQASEPGRRRLAAIVQAPRDPVALARLLAWVRELELKEGREPAVTAALDQRLPAATRAAALLAIAKVGDAGAARRLAPLLDDRTAVGTVTVRRMKITAELRDVALAVLIHLAGQKPADYGFPYFGVVPGLKELPSPERLGFADEASRTAALARWRMTR